MPHCQDSECTRLREIVDKLLIWHMVAIDFAEIPGGLLDSTYKEQEALCAEARRLLEKR
mgnify:FL=1